MSKEKIVSAACEYQGLVFSVEQPGRHGDVMIKMNDWNFDMTPLARQGFLTDKGRFVDRKEAKQIAIKSGQTVEDSFPELYSENLW